MLLSVVRKTRECGHGDMEQVKDSLPIRENGRISSLGSFQSGQMELTVNQLAQPSGVRIPHCPPDVCPCGAAVAHSLGKTGVMGSIPITGSCFSLSKGWLWPGSVERNNCNRLLHPVPQPRLQAVGHYEAGTVRTKATRRRLLNQAFPVEQLLSSPAHENRWEQTRQGMAAACLSAFPDRSQVYLL